MATTFYVDIVSPSGSVFTGKAVRLRAPGIQGSFEVLHNHAPMIAAIELGPLYVTLSSGERIAFATTGGFIEVLNNTVTVLAEDAEPASEIDLSLAELAEQAALEQLKAGGTVDERAMARQALERARLRKSMGSVGKR